MSYYFHSRIPAGLSCWITSFVLSLWTFHDKCFEFKSNEANLTISLNCWHKSFQPYILEENYFNLVFFDLYIYWFVIIFAIKIGKDQTKKASFPLSGPERILSFSIIEWTR